MELKIILIFSDLNLTLRPSSIKHPLENLILILKDTLYTN